MSARVLQRVVLPLEPDQDILPLYVEGDLGRTPIDTRAHGAPAEQLNAGQVTGRRSFTVDPRTRASFGTYFNAFPASYWRKWTVVTEVTLSVTVSGTGQVAVYRSTARGAIYRVDAEAFTSAHGETFTFTLPLNTFADGGWYWFDVVAGDDSATLDEAHWEADAAGRDQGTVTVGITTLNRADDVVALLGQLGSDQALLDILDRVTVVDQGTQHPEDAAGFAAAETRLGGRLKMIRQANLGGSGGFSRGMSETLDEAVSTYHLISDDDLRTEPEGILRAVAFADLARRPTIVGGHMFSLFDRALLHSMGERINPWRFWWGPAFEDIGSVHLRDESLRGTGVLHRRVDVDYNGWWMELIPVSVIREVGLSLPVFIKWDDAEYGLRAREHGVPTVSLPGVAAWHVPWTDKDDSIDWQAYYHERNRMVAALLHTPHKRGGRLVRESFLHHVRHLLTSQYSVVELRNQALEDLLSGPEHLHAQLDTRLGRIRETRARYTDAVVKKEPDAFPSPRGVFRGSTRVMAPHWDTLGGAVKFFAEAGKGLLRQLRPLDPEATTVPQAEVQAPEAHWATLVRLDSAVVSLADGSGAAWYQRQPEEFRRQFRRTVDLHQRLLREWPTLAVRYRAALPDLAGQDAWKATFIRTGSTELQPTGAVGSAEAASAEAATVETGASHQ